MLETTANLSGNIVKINRKDAGFWQFNCWSPGSTKWHIWNPLDPDGSKAAAEKKKKETDDIQRQILELQVKLEQLK